MQQNRPISKLERRGHVIFVCRARQKLYAVAEGVVMSIHKNQHPLRLASKKRSKKQLLRGPSASVATLPRRGKLGLVIYYIYDMCGHFLGVS
jgi:hypothetical protein